MQYVGKVGGYVYNQWNSLNPATLSGAIDVIVIEQPDGTLHCSPWHIRFGKFQIIKPSQKKIDLYVNEIKTDLPLKLGEGGEAFFVFETDNVDDLSQSVLTSPVISPVSSPGGSPGGSPQTTPSVSNYDLSKEPDLLDLNGDIEKRIHLSPLASPAKSASPVPSFNSSRIAFEKARKITQKLNIPSKIDINGDMVLDMDGYKPNAQKNIDNSDEFFKKIFFKEIQEINNGSLNSSGRDPEKPESTENEDFEDEINLWDQIISKDENGNIRILNKDPTSLSLGGNELGLDDNLTSPPPESLTDLEDSHNGTPAPEYTSPENPDNKTYFKTLRLTSEQLQSMNLHYGENSLRFKSSEGTSQVLSNLYLWKSHTPIVISDIDGTITKSDALGHVLNLIGRDWTHPGVANLFQDISFNGYNIVYVTARSVGQADSTRQYLRGIAQDGGIKLPKGPVILSPDRTMAALKREVILKKPEVFKMACLNDIKSLYFKKSSLDADENLTPFYAGFGNRITDAISYRSVKIPSHRIFTINPNGEVHMELLELAGYKSSYLHIGELVDHFFPPIKEVSTLNTYWNNNQLNEYINNRNDRDGEENGDGPEADYFNKGSPSLPESPGSPGSPRSYLGSPRIGQTDLFEGLKTDEKFNDVNYWREPINFSDLSEEDDDSLPPTGTAVSTVASITGHATEPNSPGLLSIGSFGSENKDNHSDLQLARDEMESGKRARSKSSASSVSERPVSMTAFTSPLKNFMMFGTKNTDRVEDDDDDDEAEADSSLIRETLNSEEYNKANSWTDPDSSMITNDSDFTGAEDEDEDDEDDDDYTDDDEDEDGEEDEEEDEDDYEDDYEDDIDEEEDLDYGDDGIPEEVKQSILNLSLNEGNRDASPSRLSNKKPVRPILASDTNHTDNSK